MENQEQGTVAENALVAQEPSQYPFQREKEREIIIKRLSLAERNNWFGKDPRNKKAEEINGKIVYECLNNGRKWLTGMTAREEAEMSQFFNEEISKYAKVTDPHPYYSRKENKLDATDTVILNSKNPRDYVLIKWIEACKYIAPSIQDYKSGEYSEATHYMYIKEVAQKEITDRLSKKAKAYIALEELSLTQLRTVIEIFTNQSMEAVSEATLKEQYEVAIQENINRLAEIVTMSDSYRSAQGVIIRAIEKQVITENNKKLFYVDLHLGNNIESAANYLSSEENQELFFKIKAKVTNL